MNRIKINNIYINFTCREQIKTMNFVHIAKEK